MARSWVSDTFYAGYVKIRAKNGYEFEHTYGPYEKASAALAQVSSDVNYFTRAGGTILESEVRVGTVTWKKADIAVDKKERAAQLRAEKKQAKEDAIQAKRDEFFEELNS